MPAFKVLRVEYEANELPAMCMSCGRPSESLKEKVFSITPAWVFIFLPFAIIRFLIHYQRMNRRKMIAVPLCRRHKSQWIKRYSLLWGSLLVLIGLLVLAVIGKADWLFFLFIACVLGILFWPMFALIIHGGTLRVVEFDGDSAIFAGVSRKWIQAMKQKRAERATIEK